MPKAKTPSVAAAPVVAAAPPVPVTGLRRGSLAGFAVQSPAGKTAKSYPLLPDPAGLVAEMVTMILD